MRRRLLIVAALAAPAALAAACVAALACRAQAAGGPEQGLPARWGKQAKRLQQAVLRAVAQMPPSHPLRRRYRLAIAFGDALFPPDDNLRAAPGQPQDPALAAWLALPRAERAHDVLITPDADYFWPQDGRDYSARFIVHIAGAGDASVAVPERAELPGPASRTGMAGDVVFQVLQVHATQRLGRRFHLLGRTGPGYYWELRPAAPSAQAAAGLASFVAAIAVAPLEGEQR